MKILTCPVNGPRNIAEFQYLGPVRAASAEEPGQLIEALFYAENPLGIMHEWWRHMPSNTILIAERHTVTDRIVATYLPNQKPA
ncbi:sarcosine oxidase subunit delta [Mesorhizobium sp. CU2]|uniref:sarcosine oxidase subunit delta n=1 Tax=unclassified Mesorhizobium TaxID=325217 RepID=UPI00112E72F4|nr:MULTISPECIES: sarcosine oxidase subunit delta [unclassified Mesorhizobium]TPN89418.1 sarcosine oxidase subunit delta [Mesorhizobium sp. CU3]TPO22218.1 sarcosine oxidase subunit delta [Mesorhizobium sp. CU2]